MKDDSFYEEIEPVKNANKDSNSSNSLEVASLVTGILSLFIPFVGFVLAIVSIITAVSSKKNGHMSGMAVAGLVLSIICLVISIPWILILLGFLSSSFLQSILESMQNAGYLIRLIQ